MTGSWPILPEVAYGLGYGQNAGASQGSTVISPTAANAKGAWTELISATDADTRYLIVQLLTQGTVLPSTRVWTDLFSQDYGPTGGVVSLAATAACIDIGLGAAGSEAVLIANLVTMGYGGGRMVPVTAHYAFPLEIPAGTRIAARAQANAGNAAVYVSLQIFDGALTAGAGAQLVDTFGFNAATTLGTTIDAGLAINTKGSWSQLAAATPYDLAGFIVGFDVQGDVTSQTAGHEYLIDIGTGPGGSERVVLPDLCVFSFRSAGAGGFSTLGPLCSPYYPAPIPAGTRIAARAQDVNNVAIARTLGITLYGVRA